MPPRSGRRYFCHNGTVPDRYPRKDRRSQTGPLPASVFFCFRPKGRCVSCRTSRKNAYATNPLLSAAQVRGKRRFRMAGFFVPRYEIAPRHRSRRTVTATTAVPLATGTYTGKTQPTRTGNRYGPGNTPKNRTRVSAAALRDRPFPLGPRQPTPGIRRQTVRPSRFSQAYRSV